MTTWTKCTCDHQSPDPACPTHGYLTPRETPWTERLKNELGLWKVSFQATLRLIRTRRLVATLEWLDAQLVAKGR